MSMNNAKTTDASESVPLPGIDGGNPRDFLASLGVLDSLSDSLAPNELKMSWTAFANRWRPVIHGRSITLEDVVQRIAESLGCPFRPDRRAEEERKSAEHHFNGAKTALKKAEESRKRRKLAGRERSAAEVGELEPLRSALREGRESWLAALRECVPSPELALGKHPNATASEFASAASTEVHQVKKCTRTTIDLFAAFGSDACLEQRSRRIQVTPFCFVTGSGHQYFLDTARQLYEQVDAARIKAALVGQRETHDEKLSMRWDPVEDRRHALMWRDPTASNNKAKTNWALNLLAYRGLQLVPSAPTARGLRSVGWTNGRNPTWTWALWSVPLPLAPARSLLSHRTLVADTVDRPTVAALGVPCVYRSDRIEVGTPPLIKVNFTPARRIA